ncbi:MAG: glycosyltransferase family 2 protein [Bacteroidota bacterium]|nr:glycosyltransferase family 2 protein [Candidatus Kapabacteria bacterium]MDW8219953.1 glycosyltransferase family 2 protein [Bacteroidota bacterium]
MPYLSLIIPAYNEANRLEPSLCKALEYFECCSYSVEILVVNDGSTDATREVAERVAMQDARVRLLEQPYNMGKGAAVRCGMMAAEGEYRIFSDADFSTPIHEVERVLERLEQGVDVCIGSRGLRPSLVGKHQPWYREKLGKLVNIVVQAMFLPGITDTQCGFKGFRASVARAIFGQARLNGWMFDVEVLYIAMLLGFRIEEIPVEWYNDERSTVRLSHAWQIIREMRAIKRLHAHLYHSAPQCLQVWK